MTQPHVKPLYPAEALYANAWLLPLFLAFLGIGLTAGAFALDHLNLIPDTLALQFDLTKNYFITLVSISVALLSIGLSLISVMLSVNAVQLGPRLIRVLIKQSRVQMCFGFFIAIFIYFISNLLLLSRYQHYSLVSILGLFLAVLSMFILIYLIDYVRKSVQIDSVIAYLGQELLQTISRYLVLDEGNTASSLPPTPTPAALKQAYQQREVVTALVAPNNGYIQTLDYARCLTLATAHDLFIDLSYQPGDYVWAQLPVAKIWSPAGRAPSAEVLTQLKHAFTIHIEKSAAQDILYGFEQLAEIAMRALSPSMANPYTACACIDRIFLGFSHLLNHHLPPVYHCDTNEVIRLKTSACDYTAIVHSALRSIRYQGADSILVCETLLMRMQQILTLPNAEKMRPVLVAEAEAIYDTALAQSYAKADEQRLRQRFESICRLPH